MEIQSPIECKVVKRLNRFVVEIKVDNLREKAYINNTGRLSELLVENKTGYCLKNSKPLKTSYRLFAISDHELAALIDTQLQMKAFEKALINNFIPWLKECEIIGRNVQLGKSKIDYLVKCMNKRIYVEVKSAVLRGNERYAMYPDCPSVRGRRHILELLSNLSKGGFSILLFIAALPKVDAFRPNREGDPEISKLIKRGIKRGLIVKAISMCYDPRSSVVRLDNPNLKVELE